MHFQNSVQISINSAINYLWFVNMMGFLNLKVRKILIQERGLERMAIMSASE